MKTEVCSLAGGTYIPAKLGERLAFQDVRNEALKFRTSKVKLATRWANERPRTN